MVLLFSLATGMLCDMAMGPYQGKETGEPALFRELLDRLVEGDIVLADRFYCSYFMIALLMELGVDFVVRLHQARTADFRHLGKGDHVVTWIRPAKPEWMGRETYDRMPESIEVREVLVQVDQPGFRTQSLVVVTTLCDAEEYTAKEIGQLYRGRWLAEVFHAQCGKKDNLYRGGRWSYSGRTGVAEVGTLVPATQAFRFRRKPMRDVKEDVVPPRAQQDAISVSL
jgi:hypothetical protein